MPAAELLKPTLYRAAGTAAWPAAPALLGGACKHCGYAFFPLQRFGCEACGGVDIEERALSGHGALLASTRVHMHAGKNRQAPFTVGSIRLDDGPIIRTLILEGEAPLRPGDAMIAVLEDVRDGEGQPRRDLRFRPAQAGGQS